MASRDPSTRFHPYKKTKPISAPRELASGSGGLSINDLKRRIRDVKRLLNNNNSSSSNRHADLSPEARIVQERALAGYEKDLKDETERRQRSEMIKRYHFVRFLDRKTATKELRRLTQKQKTMEEENDQKHSAALQAIKQKIHNAQINVNYTVYCPLSEKYISLYPQDKKKNTSSTTEDGSSSDSGNGSNDEHAQKSGARKNDEKKPPLWSIVEKCTANGTLDKLRNGKLNIGFDGKPKSKVAAATAAETSSSSQKNKEKAASRDTKRSNSKSASIHKAQTYEHEEKEEEVDDDSDGGFFET